MKPIYIFYSPETDTLFEVKQKIAHHLIGMMIKHEFGFNQSVLFLGEL